MDTQIRWLADSVCRAAVNHSERPRLGGTANSSHLAQDRRALDRLFITHMVPAQPLQGVLRCAPRRGCSSLSVFQARLFFGYPILACVRYSTFLWPPLAAAGRIAFLQSNPTKGLLPTVHACLVSQQPFQRERERE
jgi:hypothetical protein